MSSLTAETSQISIEDYLAGENDGEVRHEYVAGHVYAMTGDSRTHGLIVNAIAFALTPASREQGCQLFTNDMKIHVRQSGDDAFYYPDLVLVCDPQDHEDYYVSRPCLIFEVLSESTERIDRREKLYAYTGIPSLYAYVLVAQDRRQVDIYRRTETAWVHETVSDDGAIRLDCLDMNLTLDSVYEDIE